MRLAFILFIMSFSSNASDIYLRTERSVVINNDSDIFMVNASTTCTGTYYEHIGENNEKGFAYVSGATNCRLYRGTGNAYDFGGFYAGIGNALHGFDDGTKSFSYPDSTLFNSIYAAMNFILKNNF